MPWFSAQFFSSLFSFFFVSPAQVAIIPAEPALSGWTLGYAVAARRSWLHDLTRQAAGRSQFATTRRCWGSWCRGPSWRWQGVELDVWEFGGFGGFGGLMGGGWWVDWLE